MRKPQYCLLIVFFICCVITGAKPGFCVMPDESQGKHIQTPVLGSTTQQRLIVKFKDAKLSEQKKENALQRAVGKDKIAKIRHYSKNNKKKNGTRGPAFFDALVLVELATKEKGQDHLEKIKKLPEVEYVTLDTKVYALENVPNDPSFMDLWGLRNNRQATADIDATNAWDLNQGSSEVVVAVIDSGVDYNHPDLAANIWTNTREIAGNHFDDDDDNDLVDDIHGYDFLNNDGDPMDDHYHGTHVSGTIGAVGNNRIGVTGVNWRVKIMALKFLGTDGSGDLSGAINCIEYAVNNGAHILNNSWGGVGYNQALQDAITAAHEAGLIIVAAAGNNGSSQYFSPGSMEHVLTVAATDENDQRAPFSNYGDAIDVAAPGVNILSTALNHGYRSASGTSMACPHVAGLAALIKSRNLMLTNEQIEQVIINSVDDKGDLGWDAMFGWGRINARRALDRVDPFNIQFLTTIITAPIGVVQGEISVMGIVSGDQFDSYRLEYSLPRDTSWTIFKEESNIEVEQNGLLGTLNTSLMPEGVLSIRLIAKDTADHEYMTSAFVTINNIEASLAVRNFTPVVPSLDIRGSAFVNTGTFQRYTLEIGQGLNPTVWSTNRITLVFGGNAPVTNTGLLGTVNLTGLSGYYTVRQTVYSNVTSETVTSTFYIDPYIKSNWPQVIAQDGGTQGVNVGDMDGDGQTDILVGNVKSIKAFTLAGASLFSLNFPLNKFNLSIPTVADLTSVAGDEYVSRIYAPEPLLAAHGAEMMPGFPLSIPGSPHTFNYMHTPVAYDLDEDGMKDLILAEYNRSTNQVYVYAVNHLGQALTGNRFPFIYSYPEPLMKGAFAVGDVDNDGHAEIFFSVSQYHQVPNTMTFIEGKSTLFGINHLGQLLPGFPIDFNGFTEGNLKMALGDIVLGDIDGDGHKEIIFNETAIRRDPNNQAIMNRYAVHAFKKDGSEKRGWPFKIEGSYEALDYMLPLEGGMIALADVTGDDIPEVISTTMRGNEWLHNLYKSKNFVRVLNGNGTLNYALGNYTNSEGVSLAFPAQNIVAADLDGDRQAEILVDQYINEGQGIQVSATLIYKGTTLLHTLRQPPFTKPDGTLGVPILPDNGNGTILASLGSAQVGLVQMLLGPTATGIFSTIGFYRELPYSVSAEQLEWPMFQGNPSHTGEYIPRGLRNSNTGSDTMPPLVAIVTPQPGTVSGKVAVQAVATDNVGVEHVELYIDGEEVASFNSLPFQYEWDTRDFIAGGSHTLYAKAYDSVGNTGVSSPVTVTVGDDLVLPEAVISSPMNNQTISGNIPVEVNTSDNVAVIKVEIYVDGILKGLSSGTSSPHRFDINSVGLPTGNHVLEARAYDTAGNMGRSLPVNITLTDQVAPSVTIVAPRNNDTVSGILMIDANVADDVGATQAELYIDGEFRANSSGTSSLYRYGVNSANLRPGSHTLEVRAYDAAGHVGVSPVVQIAVADQEAPGVIIDAPMSEATLSTSPQEIRAIASDNVGVTMVEFYVDGILKDTNLNISQSNINTFYNYSWAFTSANNGVRSITVKAYDAAGHMTPLSMPVTVNIPVSDTQAPMGAAITAPINSTTFTTASTVNITARASDNVGVTRMEFYDKGILKATSTSAPFTYAWPVTSAENGSHSFTVKAFDAANNASTLSRAVAVTINIPIPDTQAPIGATITFPANGATYTTASTVMMTARASDNVAVTRMEFYDRGVLKATSTSAPFTYAWSITSANNGSHSFTVKAYDAANNASTLSRAVALTVNIPVTPASTVNNPLPNTFLQKKLFTSSDSY